MEWSIPELPLSKLCTVPFALQNRALVEGEKGAKRCWEQERRRGGQQRGQKGKKDAWKQVRILSFWSSDNSTQDFSPHHKRRTLVKELTWSQSLAHCICSLYKSKFLKRTFVNWWFSVRKRRRFEWRFCFHFTRTHTPSNKFLDLCYVRAVLPNMFQSGREMVTRSCFLLLFVFVFWLSSSYC